MLTPLKHTDSPKSKAHYWLLMPSIFFCLTLGFLGSLLLKFSYQEIKAVEFEDTNFLSLKIVLALAFVFGFSAKRLLTGLYETYLELALLILLILEAYVITHYSSGILQVDYIFSTSIVQFFSFCNFFSAGFFLSSLRKVRLWAFLIGGISFFIYIQYQKNLEINSLLYIVPTLTLLVVELVMGSFLVRYNKPSIHKKLFLAKPINDVLFYSSLTLFLAHGLLYYYRSEDGPDALIAGGGLGLIIFNMLYHLRLIQENVKWSFLIGRAVVAFNLVLTMNQSYIENLYFFLFFLDFGTMAIFRPKKLRKSYTTTAILSGLAIAYISYELHLKYTKNEFLYSFLLVIVNLVWLALIFKNSLGVINKISTLIVSFALTAYFFTPLPFLYEIQYSTKPESIQPIPFTMAGLNLNEGEYVFFNTTLPFANSPMLPKKRDFKNKVVVLGIRKRPELVLTYVKYLNKHGYPYIIFQSKNSEILSSEGLNFTFHEYPLFRIYFPNSGIPGKTIINPKEIQSSGWEREFIESKYRNLTTSEEIADALDQVISYSSYDLATKAKEHRKPFFESYKKYAEYYYKSKDYNLSISLAALALRFQAEEETLLNITYKSLLHTTPEPSHILIMNKLIAYPQYKEMILKRLYPILLASGKNSEALSRIDELISVLKSKSPEELTNELEILNSEKVKIFIKTQKFYEAEDWIKKELAKAPQSPTWIKLQNDLKYIRDTTQRSYYYSDYTQKTTEESNKP
jgi:hypothetical protein